MIVMVDISKHSKYTTLKIYVPLFIAGVWKQCEECLLSERSHALCVMMTWIFIQWLLTWQE